ncbi:MAG: right-handed parallel beta-helix repeat-containing protein, partial [Desulfobulbaceae bacterium]|nr:right-handed parallel beta-helix repeat-containing protein [Desulfobulbaceae bacterium]
MVGLTELIVNGSLEAVGQVAAPIIFTSSSAAPAKGDWGGIRMAGNGTLTLEHTVIEYGLLGIAYDSDGGYSEVRVRNSTVRYTKGIGISIYVHSGTRPVTLTNNHVHDHDKQGIYLQSSGTNTVLTGTVTGNEVHNTGATGIHLYTWTSARAKLTVDGNNVYATQGNGIYSYAYNHSEVTGSFSNNEVRDTTTGLHLYNYYYAKSPELLVEGNTVHNTVTGIYVYNRGASTMSPAILDNLLYENSTTGLELYGNGGAFVPSVRHNQITNNGKGIYVHGPVTPEIVLNTVTGNSIIGMSVQCTGTPAILHNNIQGNGGNGID